MAYNFLTEMPKTLPNLAQLREFKCGSNKLKSFPRELFPLENLEVLDLSLNSISELPNGMRQMQVVDLNLNENEISFLSDDLGCMPKLQILRLQNNKLNLNSLPDNIFTESQVFKISAFLLFTEN